MANSPLGGSDRLLWGSELACWSRTGSLFVLPHPATCHHAPRVVRKYRCAHSSRWWISVRSSQPPVEADSFHPLPAHGRQNLDRLPQALNSRSLHGCRFGYRRSCSVRNVCYVVWLQDRCGQHVYEQHSSGIVWLTQLLGPLRKHVEPRHSPSCHCWLTEPVLS